MARKPQRTVTTVTQLEPLLKAYALRRLEEQSGGQAKPAKAKLRPKKRKKA